MLSKIQILTSQVCLARSASISFVEMDLLDQTTGAETTTTLEIEHDFTLQAGYKVKMAV